MRKLIAVLFMLVCLCLPVYADETYTTRFSEVSEDGECICSLFLSASTLAMAPEFEIYLNKEGRILKADYLNEDAQKAFKTLDVDDTDFEEGMRTLLDAIDENTKGKKMQISTAVFVSLDVEIDVMQFQESLSAAVEEFESDSGMKVTVKETGTVTKIGVTEGENGEIFIEVERNSDGDIVRTIEILSDGNKNECVYDEEGNLRETSLIEEFITEEDCDMTRKTTSQINGSGQVSRITVEEVSIKKDGDVTQIVTDQIITDGNGKLISQVTVYENETEENGELIRRVTQKKKRDSQRGIANEYLENGDYITTGYDENGIMDCYIYNSLLPDGNEAITRAITYVKKEDKTICQRGEFTELNVRDGIHFFFTIKGNHLSEMIEAVLDDSLNYEDHTKFVTKYGGEYRSDLVDNEEPIYHYEYYAEGDLRDESWYPTTKTEEEISISYDGNVTEYRGAVYRTEYCSFILPGNYFDELSVSSKNGTVSWHEYMTDSIWFGCINIQEKSTEDWETGYYLYDGSGVYVNIWYDDLDDKYTIYDHRIYLEDGGKHKLFLRVKGDHFLTVYEDFKDGAIDFNAYNGYKGFATADKIEDANGNLIQYITYGDWSEANYYSE